MARNAIKSDFRSSKMAAGGHLVTKFPIKKVAYWSEVARNAIESDFRSSKMAAPATSWNKFKKIESCIFIWNGEKCKRKWFSVIQNVRRRPFCGKKFRKMKVAYWSEMARNVIESDFRSYKMAAGGHFVTKFKNKILRHDLKWRESHTCK